MGLLQKIAGNAGAPPLEAAQGAVASAEQAVAEVAKHIATTEEEIAEITKTIASTDPDAAGGVFAKLVARRDALRGRLEALGSTAERAAGALAASRDTLAAAERANKADELALLRADLSRIDGELLAASEALERKIDTELARLSKMWDRAYGIAFELRQAGVEVGEITSAWWVLYRGTGKRALELAASIVGDKHYAAEH